MDDQRANYEKLDTVIFGQTGLRLDHNKYDEIIKTMFEVGIVSSDELLNVLRANSVQHPVWQFVMKAVTIGETYFFRNKNHFAALEQTILPALIAQRRKSDQKFLRIWSAGCATGEEPYSIAILLRRLLPDIQDWMITLLATDINMQYLERARAGLYKPHAFRGETPPEIQTLWFTEHNKHYEIDPVIKKMVHFAPLNLASDEYPSYQNNSMNQDIILCRNVTIYFTQQQTVQVIERFHRALNSDGWLIVGHSEPQQGLYSAFKSRHISNAIFYQKGSIEEIIPTPSQAAKARQTGTALPARRTPTPHMKPSSASVPPILPPPAQPPQKSVPSPQKSVASPQKSVASPAVPTSAPHAQARGHEENILQEIWQQAKQAADQEQWDTALQLLKSLENKNVLQPQVHYLRALIQMQTEQGDAAKDSLRRAIYCDPGFVLAHYTLGEFHEQRNQPKEALRHWKMAQGALEQMQLDTVINYSDELTAEMLNDLLNFRLGRLFSAHPELASSL